MAIMTVIHMVTGEVTEVEVPDGEIVAPPPTVEDYRLAVQAHVDAVAVSRLYTDGNSLATYAASTNPQWAAEAQAFVAWRDSVWTQVYALWANPPETPPSLAELVASLPEIVWP